MGEWSKGAGRAELCRTTGAPGSLAAGRRTAPWSAVFFHRRPLAAGLFAPVLMVPASAHAAPLLDVVAGGVSPVALLAGCASLAALGLGLACAIRSRAAARMQRAGARALTLARADAMSLAALLGAGTDGAAIWLSGNEPPMLMGAAGRLLKMDAAGTGEVPDLSLWLGAGVADSLSIPLQGLFLRDEPFSRDMTVAGVLMCVEGKAVAGNRVVTTRRLSASAEGEVSTLPFQGLFRASALPVWQRDLEGRLVRVNPAFAAAVGGASPEEVCAKGLELLDQPAREASAAARRKGEPYQARVRVVAGGRRQILDVLEVPGPQGSAGLAVDATAAEALRGEIERTIAAHRRTLDQLATAVAMFGADERLQFHNSAYERLFELDPAFLDERPTESEILERMRLARRVPEQADFRAWREHLRDAYRALEPVHDWWHLPGGQMLRVVATPNAEGGVTYLFEDLSERISLESRYNSLIRIQGETLDGLAEAVAVFGSDGRLRLYNQAFLALWSLSAQALGERPHIDAVAAMCRPLYGETGTWARIRSVITAIEHRRGEQLRLERADGRVLDGAAQPLPDGGTMVTFRDVTDSVKVERALIERNEALEAADVLKNAFVGHVSYHLRTPLNTLIGYAHMLGETAIGPLNDRQREFLDHVRQSSDTLRALIDDILDLATIDAGAMALDLGEVDVRGTLEGVAEAVRDLLEQVDVTLHIDAASDVGLFVADGRRVRQILFNLLSNAIAAAPPGTTVVLSAERRPDAVVLKVRDQGAGISPELTERLFDRFETGPAAGGRGGVGLGLSIVRSFMTLHGGTVSLQAAPGGGTVATCVFPFNAPHRSEAAA